MTPLGFLVLAVFCGVASADLWEYNLRQSACLAADTKVALEMTYCDNFPPVQKCLVQAAKDAKVENRDEFKDVLNGFIDMCKNGTEANNLYKNNRECVKNSLSDKTKLMECSAELLKEIAGQSPEEQNSPKTFQRITCKYSASLNACLMNFVKTECADGGAKLYEVFQVPTVRLIKKACLESGNGAGMATANMYFSIFQVIAALSLIKWFSH